MCAMTPQQVATVSGSRTRDRSEENHQNTIKYSGGSLFFGILFNLYIIFLWWLIFHYVHHKKIRKEGSDYVKKEEQEKETKRQ